MPKICKQFAGKSYAYAEIKKLARQATQNTDIVPSDNKLETLWQLALKHLQQQKEKKTEQPPSKQQTEQPVVAVVVVSRKQKQQQVDENKRKGPKNNKQKQQQKINPQNKRKRTQENNKKNAQQVQQQLLHQKPVLSKEEVRWQIRKEAILKKMPKKKKTRVAVSRDARWEQKYDKLRAYAMEKGCNVNDYGSKMSKQQQTKSLGTHAATKNMTYGESLAKWCEGQRKAYRNEQSRMTKPRISKLKRIGFKWDSPSVYWWKRNYHKLRAYALEDNCNVNDYGSKMKRQLQTKNFGSHVAEKNQEYGQELSKWCEKQRKAYRNERSLLDHGVKTSGLRISKKQIASLKRIGFTWDALYVFWATRNKGMKEIKKYMNEVQSNQ